MPMETGRKSSTGTARWFAQAALGILLVILLGIHIIVNHWVAPQGLLSHADVIRYYQVPGIAWMEIFFLLVVTVHCLLGLHSILFDLNLPSKIKTGLTWLLIILGAVIVLYGIRLTWMVATLQPT
jgi:succinate dehydrogenase / fumarate reductase membrane anchor subunit